MTVLALDRMLEQLWEASPVPGCEVQPSYRSDEPCGDPAIALVLLVIWHHPGCPQQDVPQYVLWLCAPHLKLARQDGLVCSDCPAIAVVLKVIG